MNDGIGIAHTADIVTHLAALLLLPFQYGVAYQSLAGLVLLP